MRNFPLQEALLNEVLKKEIPQTYKGKFLKSLVPPGAGVNSGGPPGTETCLGLRLGRAGFRLASHPLDLVYWEALKDPPLRVNLKNVV